MYFIKSKDKKVKRASDLELDISANLAASYKSLVYGFEELRITEAKASEQRASIIKELQQLSASLDALPNRATQIGGERND